MMRVEAGNPLVKRLLYRYLSSDFSDSQKFQDYDTCTFQCEKNSEAKEIKFGFTTLCSKQIMESGGQEMLTELYPEYAQVTGGDLIENSDITLRIPMKDIYSKQKVEKSLSEEAQEAIR